jgi:hypothetical protein
VSEDPAAASILRLARAAGAASSIAPEAVARDLAGADPGWQRMLPRVRQSAIDLARVGAIEILRKGKPVDDPTTAKGVLRYRLKV